jgi:hypothetical protein
MGKYSFGADGPTFNGVSLINDTTLVSPSFVSVTTTATPATGSCAVQFVFSDANGVITEPVSGLCYLSEAATGLTHDLANTSLAVLTNGALTNIGGAGPSLFTTTAAGLLGMTITAVADDYYVVFVKPDGSLLISDVCTVSA